MTQKILIETIPTDNGSVIGTLTLNDPKALNALSVEMGEMLNAQLDKWLGDSKVVAIILKGSGEKAFCAGGNIRNLYDSMVTNPPMPNPYAEKFFQSEYGLFRKMHFYPKPIILWANGIVMGGGMGLMAMSSHRVVTETTRFAMPEITIGLYPDATGSWMLQRMPAKSGLFLGLTGAQCNASDALLVNMAECAVRSDTYDSLVDVLKAADWANSESLHDTATYALGKIHHAEHLPESNIANHWLVISEIVNKGNISDIDEALRNPALLEKYADDKWLTFAVKGYLHGCPVSAALTFEIFKRAKNLSLEQALYMEYNLSMRCANNPDFREGVRALLIDKDKSPQWSRTLAECDKQYIDSHFISVYKDEEHPFTSWLDSNSQANKSIKI